MEEEFVQRIDFVLSYTQIMSMLLNDETTGIRVTLGITEKGAIKVEADGIKHDSSGRITRISDPQHPCPIPPDCPQKVDCPQKLSAHMGTGINSASTGLAGIAKVFFNK